MCDSVFSAAITTQRWDVYVEAAWINRLCHCRQSDSVRLWITKNLHLVVIVIYVWETWLWRRCKKVKLCLPIDWVWTSLVPGWGQHASKRLEFRWALGSLCGGWPLSLIPSSKARKGFLQVNKKGKKSLGCSSAEFFLVKRYPKIIIIIPLCLRFTLFLQV